MEIPSIHELQQAAREIVRTAKALGELESVPRKPPFESHLTFNNSALTPRLVRQQLEQKYSLEEEALATEEYRRPLKVAITAEVVCLVSIHGQVLHIWLNADC